METSIWLISIECLRLIPLWVFWHNIEQRRPENPIRIFNNTIHEPTCSLDLWSICQSTSLVPTVSTPSIQVPLSTPSLGMTLPVVNPSHPSFAEELNAQGTVLLCPKQVGGAKPKPNQTGRPNTGLLLVSKWLPMLH